MEHVIVFIVLFIISGIISWRWVNGIDYMGKHHPKYKGDDFLNLGDDSKVNKDDQT